MMRKGFVLAALAMVMALALLCSCATGTDINEKNKDGSPIWTTEIPKSSKLLYGVGKAKLLMESNSEQAADAAARNDLALKISANMDSAMALYSNEASTAVVNAYESLIVQSVNLTMKRVVVEQRWTAPDGTVWSLVSFRIKDLPDLFKDAANDYMNQLEEKRIATEAKLAALMAELGESTEDDVLEMKRLAQEKADSIISEVQEIVSNVDVDNIAEGLASYLVENGYELTE